MTFDEQEGKRWADLCARHEAATRDVDAALRAVQDKFRGVGRGRPINPTREEMPGSRMHEPAGRRSSARWTST
jgi:hypothetical protein